jgi:hypothetical protein
MMKSPWDCCKNRQKRGFLPAQIEKRPHGWENRRTDGELARTKWKIARTD